MLIEPSSLPPIRTLEAWEDALRSDGVRIIGDGAARYEAAIHERLGGRAQVLTTPPIAGIIGRLAAASPARAVPPHAVVPIYIRRPDAELARSRQTK